MSLLLGIGFTGPVERDTGGFAVAAINVLVGESMIGAISK